MRYIEPAAAQGAPDRVTWGPRPRAKLQRWRRLQRATEWPWPREPRAGSGDIEEVLEYTTLWLALDTLMRRHVHASRRFGARAWEGGQRRRMQARLATRPGERYEATTQRAWASEYWAARRWLLGLPGGAIPRGHAHPGRPLQPTAKMLGVDEAKLREWMKGASI